MKRTLLQRVYAIFREHLGLNFTRIHPRVTKKLYLGRASVRHCDSSCCRDGATLSVDERDRVLAHAAIVATEMSSRARRDPSIWFNRRLKFDPDFTAGWTSATRVLDGACVFLRADGLCALQVAGDKHLGSGYALKPSTCLLWPLCIQNGALELGYAWFTRRRECCAPVREGGGRTILQVVRPDERRFAEMARPGISRGGGPPLPGARRSKPRPPLATGASPGSSASRGSSGAWPRRPAGS